MFLQGAFVGPGGRWRARLGPAKGIQIKFDTRDSSFRVLSGPSDGGLSALFFPTVGDKPLLSRDSHHARRYRGGLIARPFFHVSWPRRLS